MTIPDFDNAPQPGLTPEQSLERAATFMTTHGITANLIDGPLDDGRFFEGLVFDGQGTTVATVAFIDGQPLPCETEELQRRLQVPGLATEVIRPVVRAATTLYGEGSDLLDERFDVLPGFME